MSIPSRQPKESPTALLLVDIQNDFLPGGALPVPQGDKILPVIQELLKLPFALVVASKDYHPAKHISFASTHARKTGAQVSHGGHRQRLWPDHCQEGTFGAEYASVIPGDKIDKFFFKGSDPLIDSYSAFFDNKKLRSTGLREYLKEKGIQRIAIAGLATDYCVLWSVLDAISLGFEVDVIVEGCRGINLTPGDVNRALKEMEEAGARLFQTIATYRSFSYLCNT